MGKVFRVRRCYLRDGRIEVGIVEREDGKERWEAGYVRGYYKLYGQRRLMECGVREGDKRHLIKDGELEIINNRIIGVSGSAEIFIKKYYSYYFPEYRDIRGKRKRRMERRKRRKEEGG